MYSILVHILERLHGKSSKGPNYLTVFLFDRPLGGARPADLLEYVLLDLAPNGTIHLQKSFCCSVLSKFFLNIIIVCVCSIPKNHSQGAPFCKNGPAACAHSEP